MRIAMKWSVVVASIFFSLPASATTFAFIQTGATDISGNPVPGFTVNASITINGTLADLPTICNQGWGSGGCGPGGGDPPPYNFAPLQDLKISWSGGGKADLSEFTAACIVATPLCNDVGYPAWHISPNEIAFTDFTDSFFFDIKGFGTASSILVMADGDIEPGICFLTMTHCTGIGDWVSVPEPPTIWLVLAVMAMLGLMVQFRRASQIGGLFRST